MSKNDLSHDRRANTLFPITIPAAALAADIIRQRVVLQCAEREEPVLR
jgi:hypothetical protein